MLRASGSRRRRLVAAAVCLPVLLASCSGTADAPDAAPSPTRSASGTPSTSAPSEVAAEDDEEAEAAPEPPAPRRGRTGQQAFARHVMASWVWALRTNDPAPILAVSGPRGRLCDGCAALRDELRERRREGWYVDLAGIDVESVRLRAQGAAVVAVSRVDVPQSDTLHTDGTFRSTNPAHDDATFTVRMRWTPKGYVLESFTVG